MPCSSGPLGSRSPRAHTLIMARVVARRQDNDARNVFGARNDNAAVVTRTVA